MTLRLALARLLLVASGLLSALVAHADAPKPWPGAKPITWVVGFVPGGSVDVLTRAIAKNVSEKLGQSIVVENRPGASGALALQFVSRAPADGYTLLTYPGPILHARRQPEIGKELAAAALMSEGPIVFVGTAATTPANLHDLTAAMKKDPNKWDFASSGNGTGQHLAGELFNAMAGTKMVHVPYKGGGQAVTDVVGGQVSLGMLGVTPVLPHIKSGTLRAFAVTTPFRIASLPDVPSMDEAGLKGYDATQFFVAAVPTGTNVEIVTKLNAAISEAVQSQEVKVALDAAGQVPGGLNAAKTQEYVLQSLAKFRSLAQNNNISLN